ncbi:MAG: hypothetical protein K2W96_08245, partial [Gemmataceae bacterium]|nr:hypothetical protein [Gemmataceae bacterium]
RDLREGKPAGEIEGRWERLDALAFLPGDPPTLLAGGEEGFIAAWDVQERKRLRMETGHAGGVRALALLPDGRLATAAEDRVVRVWDLATGKARVIPIGFPGGAYALAAVGDGLLAVGGKHESVHLLDLESGELAGELRNGWWTYALSPLPGGRLLVGGKSDHAEIWDAKAKARLKKLPRHRENLECSASHGERFATGDGAWDGEGTARVFDGDKVKDYPGHFGAVSALALGARLATGDRKGVVRIDGKPVAEAHPSLVSALAWSPDGTRLASACEAGEVVWRGADGKRLAGWKFPGAVLSLRVTEDGTKLVTGNADGTVFVLELP